ncbi:mosc domain protein [Stigmatella aurantiaca DW4/3-1]|nr:mosc domain protein [Stigmatella aurantiaca DW4/3-1]
MLGDRAYALIDRETGHVASAKHPRKWSKLIECRAAFEAPPQPGEPLPPVRITLPDGTELCSTQPDVEQVLSRVLGREVTLTSTVPEAPTREANRAPIDGSPDEELIRSESLALAAPTGTFFDHAPLHVLTTATLARLSELYPSGRFEPRRFRPNLLIGPSEGEGFVENGWLGRSLQVGPDVRMRLIDPSPRCVITTLAQGDLPRDPGILRTVGAHVSAASVTFAPGVVFPAVAGAYATVLHGGRLRKDAALHWAASAPR